MVAIVPNKTKIEGRILSISPSADAEDFSILHIQPKTIKKVKGSVSLLTPKTQEVLHIHVANIVRQEHQLQEGTQLSALVRKAPDRLYILPDSVHVTVS